MTMTGYLAALNNRYKHLAGEKFDWGSQDHAVRAVLSYLLACERRMHDDITADVRSLAEMAQLDPGKTGPLTLDDATRLEERLLFLHQSSSPVARLLLGVDDIDALPEGVRRKLLESEVASLDGFLGELDRVLGKQDEASAERVSTGAGEIVAVGKDEVERIAASCEELSGSTVTAVMPIAGGMSKITNRCTLISRQRAEFNVIMRIDTAAGYSRSSVANEFGLLQRLHASGVAVPKPFASGTLRSGAAAILVAQAQGAMFGTPFESLVRSETLCRSMGTHLASIHGVDAAGLELPGAGDDPKLGVATDLAFVEENWRRIGKPDIIIECALDWLKDNIDLAAGRPSLVHGDYGPHNLLQEDGFIHAVLDWEFAKIGNPVEDLGFVLPVAETVGRWESFIDGYVSAGGKPPAADQLNFFVILARTRLAIMVAQSHDIFRRYGHFTAGVPGAYQQPRSLAELGKLLLAKA